MAIKALLNEHELVSQVIQGDERAFKILFDGYAKSIAEFIFKMTSSQEVTEEIVQNIFIKIWLKREQLGEIKHFTNYLFILSRNQTISHLRKKADEDLKYQEWEKDQTESNKSDDEIDFSLVFREKIDKAIDRLPPQQQKVFILSRRDRLKYDEIANKLGISSETVKKHLQNATKSIKIYINDPKNMVVISILLTRCRFW